MRARFALVFLVSCGAGSASTPPPDAPPPPKPRNAADIARAVAGGQVGALLYAERVRGRPIAGKLASLELWRSFFDGTGVDPNRDLERAFVTAPAAGREDDMVAIAEHRVESARMHSAMEVLLGRSNPPGEWVAGAPVPEARVTLRGHTHVVALLEPDSAGGSGFVILLPASRAGDAGRFVGTGGFPDPEGAECLRAFANDPAHTLAMPNVPPLPPTLRDAHAKIAALEDGSADVDVDATSTDDQQALADAAYLTKAADDATSVKIAIVKLRFLEPIPFRAEGPIVKAHTHLTPADVDRLLGLAAALTPR